jgi:hypothetical protein
VLLEVLDQLDAVRGALFGLAERVDLEFDARQPRSSHRRWHIRMISASRPGREAERLDADLVELAIAAALRTLVAEHRADVPQALRAVVQQVVLDRRAHDAAVFSGRSVRFRR